MCKKILMIDFLIRGHLCYLSHTDMIRLFQRALMRAELDVVYSEGFNPRIKMSLPFPKPVGVESQGDILAVEIVCGQQAEKPQNLEAKASACSRRLGERLPPGLKMSDARIVDKGKSVRPLSCTYVLKVKRPDIPLLQKKINSIVSNESLVFERGFKKKNRKVNVRNFIQSIGISGENVYFDILIKPNGTVRCDELLKLTELNMENLTDPIERRNICWKMN